MASAAGMAGAGEAINPSRFQATEMIALGAIILAAHLGGKLCRRLRLSEVTGQLVGGALVGPFALHWAGVLGPDNRIYDEAMNAFHFFVFVFLGMVAFGIGEELHISRIRRVGLSALGITVVQAFFTCAFITGGFLLFTDTSLLQAFLLGSIGIASAPAVTFVLMNQLRVEGRLRHVLGGVVVLADLVGVLVFSVVVQIANKSASSGGDGDVGGWSVTTAVLTELAIAFALGAAIYGLLALLVRRQAVALENEVEEDAKRRATDVAFLHRVLAEHPSPSAEILLVVMGGVSLGTGIAYYYHMPFLVTAIVAGFLVANLHSHAIFDSLKIDNITAVFNLGFFALVGASISLDVEAGAMWLAGLYIITRLTGAMFGTWLGCRMVGEERKITACLPTLLLPQAGVGAVEAVYASTVLGKPEIAAIVLPAIVFFEVVGVYVVDKTLRRWRSWVADEENVLKQAGAQARSGAGEAASRLLAYLGPDSVCVQFEAANKHETIDRLVDVARASSDQHIDRAQAVQVLSERERLSPTGFGHGIAIPHCRLMGLERPVLVLARHSEGVVFGGVDDNPCHLILLILSSARDPSEHLRLLAAAGHLFGNDATREALQAAESTDELLRVIRTVAER